MIDLNCDLGESFGQYRLGMDDEIIQSVSSINIACGFHAGDYDVMANTVKKAIKAEVKIGAHPGFMDLQGFGRRPILMPNDSIANMILYQIGALDAFVKSMGGSLNHVKPHGALYNMAARDYDMARSIVDAIKRYDPNLIIYGLSGSELINAAKDVDLNYAQEVFADRGYEKDGSLVSRTKDGAFVQDPKEAARRIIKMVNEGLVESACGSIVELHADTICVHGDNEKALSFVKSLTSKLIEGGYEIG